MARRSAKTWFLRGSTLLLGALGGGFLSAATDTLTGRSLFRGGTLLDGSAPAFFDGRVFGLCAGAVAALAWSLLVARAADRQAAKGSFVRLGALFGALATVAIMGFHWQEGTSAFELAFGSVVLLPLGALLGAGGAVTVSRAESRTTGSADTSARG